MRTPDIDSRHKTS